MQKMITRDEILAGNPSMKKLDDFTKDYREKLCSKCIGTNQQQQRKCLDSGVFNGHRITKCDHMVAAQKKICGKEIDDMFKNIFRPLMAEQNYQRNDSDKVVVE